MALFGSTPKVVIYAPELFLVDGGGLIALDVTMSERHAVERTATRYPIEAGGYIADHLSRTPRQLDLVAYLTDTPTDFLEAGAEAARNLQTSILQTLGTPAVTGPLASTRSKDLYHELERLASSDVTCAVITDLTTYEHMILTRLGAPRSADDGRGLTVELTFRRLIVAKTSTREALTIEEPDQPSAAAVKKVSRAQVKPAPEKPAPLQSTADAMFGHHLAP